MMRRRFRTALLTKSTAPPSRPTTRIPSAPFPGVRPPCEHLERDVVREHDEEREHDDAGGDVSVPRAPVDDVGAERECENDGDLDRRVDEARDEP